MEAFLGQTDYFNSPLQHFHLNDFITTWYKYDKEATGFIKLRDLDKFIYDLSKTDDGQSLVIIGREMAEDEDNRARLIAQLQIPTYDCFQKVMFYDVLLKLAHSCTVCSFVKSSALQGNIFGVSSTKDASKHGKKKEEILRIGKSLRHIRDFNRKLNVPKVFISEIAMLKAFQLDLMKVRDKFGNGVDNADDGFQGNLETNRSQKDS